MKKLAPFISIAVLAIFGLIFFKISSDQNYAITKLSAKIKEYEDRVFGLKGELETKEATISALTKQVDELKKDSIIVELSLVKSSLARIKALKTKSTKYKGLGVKTESIDNKIPSFLETILDLNFLEASKSASALDAELEKLYQDKLAADRKALEEAKKRFENTVSSGGYSRYYVQTDVGSFNTDMVIGDLNKVKVVTDSANSGDCKRDCPLMSLGSFVSINGGFAGINGSYFCPADYPQCSDKKGSSDFPVYSSRQGKWINKGNLFWDNRGLLTFNGSSGNMYVKEKDYGGGGVTAGIAMTPGLLKNGSVVVGSYSLDSKEKLRSTRSALGFSDSKVYLVTARGVTTYELAYVLKALGAKNGLAMDGGGSVAMYYSGGYTVGPGRALSNAIILKNR